MDKTIFEKIIEGEIPGDKVFEDENTFAFLDISPKAPGHTLVIPKFPYKNLYELSNEACNDLFVSVKKIASAVKIATNSDGIKIVMNNEPAAGQVVFHAHVHIIPYFENTSARQQKAYKYSPNEAKDLTEKIQAALK